MSLTPRFFSICAKNYLAFARTLARSLRAARPGADFTLFLADRIDGVFDPSAEPFEILEAEIAGIADLAGMAFRYDITEFNTAVKPSCINYLMDREPGRPVVYLDPDIEVFGPLDDLDRIFATGAQAIMTPHATGPIEDGKSPDDLTLLRAGVYNLGFLGIQDTPDMRAFLDWWARRLQHDCRVDLDAGIHVDQKWADLLPTFADRIHILRDPGYNIAYWNMMHRTVTGDEATGFKVNGRPLQFFHFSGGEAEDPNLFSKHQNRFTMGNAGVAGQLLKRYRQQARDNGRPEVSQWPYAYGKDEKGRAIHTIVRRLFRTEVEPKLKPGQARGDAAIAYCNEPSPDVAQSPVPITRLMAHIWRQRPDLQSAFNLATDDGRRGLNGWFQHAAIHELKLDPAYIAGALFTAPAESAAPAQAPANVVELPVRTATSSAAIAALRIAPRLRGLYQHLPQGLRSGIRTRLLREAYVAPVAASEPSSVTAPARRPAGVNLTGYVRAELGVGEGLRCMARAFDAAGVSFATRELKADHVARCDDQSLAHKNDPAMPFDVTVYHVNADQMPYLPLELEADKLAGRYRIGYWAWELETFPEASFPAFDFVDEIWVPSTFVQRAVAAAAPVPVLTIPHAIINAAAVAPDRARFGIPAGAFAFLVSFDLKSFLGRKNPEAALEAFQMAFPDSRTDVALVIKVHGGDLVPDALARLREIAAADPRCVLVEGTLDRASFDVLQASCDAYVSLHRSEGFGLHLAEAMAAGVPVIATAYSGNMDFMTPESAALVHYQLVPVPDGGYPHWQGQVWAEPDVATAAAHMTRLVTDAAWRQSLVRNGAAMVRDRLAPSIVGAAIAKRLALVRERAGA